MQSFGRPRPTSNPYIHMLDKALTDAAGLDHMRFDRRTALFGRYDAVHFHWPETLFGGQTSIKRALRRLYATAFFTRLFLSRGIAVVRTVHNVDPPKDVPPWERRLLERVERRTDFRILLNGESGRGVDGPTAVIPHGHYRDWFADIPAGEARASTLGFVGLVRRYKGVEHLISVFQQTSSDHPDMRLLIAGNPTSAEIADEVRALAASDDRIDLDLRYLPEEEFARAVMSVQAVVLPYRFMHNSGTVLAALSLGRAVLVPDNEVNAALAREVGDGWVFTYDGDLDADDLERFWCGTRTVRAGEPDLSSRGWAQTGARHLEAYRAAVAQRRTR